MNATPDSFFPLPGGGALLAPELAGLPDLRPAALQRWFEPAAYGSQAAKVGQVLTVLSDGLDEESGLYLCRTAADAPEIDGCVCVRSDTPLYPGEFYQVKIEDSDDYDLFGVLA